MHEEDKIKYDYKEIIVTKKKGKKEVIQHPVQIEKTYNDLIIRFIM